MPPRVEYELTPWGRGLEPLLLAMLDWGDRYKHRLQELGSEPGPRAAPAPETPGRAQRTRPEIFPEADAAGPRSTAGLGGSAELAPAVERAEPRGVRANPRAHKRQRYQTALSSARELLACIQIAQAMRYIGTVDPRALDRMAHVIATLARLIYRRTS